MPNREVTWRNVWAAVRTRQEELRWTDTELQKACGISETTYRKGRQDGVPLVRPAKIARLEDGLGWTPGSVAAILAGGKATAAAQSAGGDVNPYVDDALRRMEARLRTEIDAADARARGVEESLHTQLLEMVIHLEALADEVEQGRRESE